MAEKMYYLSFKNPLNNKLNKGFTINETIIPIVPACGEGMPLTYKEIHTVNPIIPDDNPPNLLVHFMKRPPMKGPRKNDPIAPHETPKMATIESGLINAIITDINTKRILAIRIKRVRPLSLTSLFIYPA